MEQPIYGSENQKMVASIGYFIACFLVGVLLTGIVALFRPIKQHDDFKSWRWMFGLTLGVIALPYLYAEIVTRTQGAQFKPAVMDVMEGAEVEGKLAFYKVTLLRGDKARIVIVADDRAEWGGTERCIITAQMTKSGNRWEASNFRVLSSFRRGRDASSIPPYW